jgi:hypothetical protein
VSAVGRLRFGGGEVEAGAAGFEGEPHDRRGVGGGDVLEAVDLSLAGRCRHRTVEVAVRDALLVEVGAEEREEGGELRKDEEAVAVVEGFGEDFAKGFQFGESVKAG